MLLSAMSVLVVAQSSSEILEGLMNNPVRYFTIISSGIRCKWPNQLNLCAFRDFVNTVMNLRVPQIFGNFLTS